MPYVFLHAKQGGYLEEACGILHEHLPQIIAEELSVNGREIHDGSLSPAEIMIWPFSVPNVVNGKDIEIVVFAHPFPARKKNIEERKGRLITRIKKLLEANHESLTFAVCVILAPMAYGEERVINPMP